MKGKLIKYNENWCVKFSKEGENENTWFNILELEPSINGNSLKDLKVVEILNKPVVDLEGLQVEFEIVTEGPFALHFDMFQYAKLIV